MEVRLIGPDELVEAAATPGIRRWLAVADERLWAGIVVTEPGVASAWHHHGDHHTLVYLLDGSMRIEWGAAGSAVDGRVGEFIHIPPHAVHREVNTTVSPARAVVVRVGTGPVVVNLDGPG